MNAYVSHVVVVWALFSAVAVPFALFSARSGYLSLMQAIFFGIGAYAAALLGNSGFGEPAIWATALLLGTFAGWFATAFVFRARADYFVILTIAVQSAATLTFTSLDSVTNGPLGLSIRSRWPFGMGAGTDVIAALAILFIACAATALAARSGFVRQLDAARQNESQALVLGYDVAVVRSMAFAGLCGLTAFAGAAFAKYLAYIDPTSFRLAESIVFLTIIVIARMGRLWTVLLSAAFFIGVPEMLRFMRLESAYLANVQQIIFGAALVAAVVMRGRGSARHKAAVNSITPPV